MKKSKSFDNLLTDLHSDPLPESAVPSFSRQDIEDVLELSPIDDEEKRKLEECERIIDEGLSTFVAVGNALLEIRVNKLYRSEYRTFEAYCRARFQIKRQRAYELMGAAEVVNTLSDTSNDQGNLLTPSKESHAAALSKLPPEKRKTVWKKISDESKVTGKPITAKQIESAYESEINKGILKNSDAVLKNIKEKQLIKKVLKSVDQAKPEEITLEIKGSWLKRNNLEDAWRMLRNRPEWVINERFKDILTLEEAKSLGFIK